MKGRTEAVARYSEEVRDLAEHASHARDDPLLKPVSLTMAILAVVLSLISLAGNLGHTAEILLQDQISNGWAHYQAKASRGHESEMFSDLAGALDARPDIAERLLQEKYRRDAHRYSVEKTSLSNETTKLESEIKSVKTENRYYDTGEVLLDIALVVTSITLLANRRIYWYLGMILGVGGALIAAAGLAFASCEDGSSFWSALPAFESGA
jgi:hypothetical protein